MRRLIAFGLLILWIALAGGALWYMSSIRGQISIAGLIEAREILFVVPNEFGGIFISPESARGIRFIGMDVGARGLQGHIGVGQDIIQISPADEFSLTPLDPRGTAYVDFRTTDPVTMEFASSDSRAQSGLEVKIQAGAMLGSDVGLNTPTVPTVEYAFRGDGPLQGSLHAASLEIWRTHRMTFGGEAVKDIRLASPEGQKRSGPIAYNAGSVRTGNLRILLPAHRPEIGQGVRTQTNRFVAIIASGRIVAGASSIALTGLEELFFTGDLKIESLHVVGNRVRAQFSGSTTTAQVSGESIIPSMLDKISSKPLWTTVFALFLVVWSTVSTLLIKLILTGKWGGE